MTEPTPGVSRRTLLIAGLAGTAVAVAGAAYAVAPTRVRKLIGLGPDPYIPDVPEGRVELESVHSQARGRDVDLFTAVPYGYGDGAGLPVVVVLHGASATASRFQDLGLARFVTAAVREGADPFVLAGADGGALRWERDPESGDDPQAMLVDELPGWLSDRGLDAERRAVWGWSMGGYGALRLAESYPAYARAVAAFSPAVSLSDSVFDDADQLAEQPLGVWCGTDDALYGNVRGFVAALPTDPVITSYSSGGHTYVYWNEHTVEALTFLASRLT
jgi:enterochelin esterase-like enzyme